MTDYWPYIVRWPDGGTAGRYGHALAARIMAEMVGGTYNYEPRENAR